MHFELETFLPYRLAVAAGSVSRRFAALYGQEAGLSTPEWRVLAHLANSGPVSIRDINTRINLEKPTVSRAAKRLQEQGLLRSIGHSGDQRLIALELTEAGQALMERLTPIAKAFHEELLRDLEEDLPTLLAVLERLEQHDKR